MILIAVVILSILLLRFPSSVTLQYLNGVEVETSSDLHNIRDPYAHGGNRRRNSKLLAARPLVDPTKFQPLPPEVIDGIKTFVFFIGISWSGHSIVATPGQSSSHCNI